MDIINKYKAEADKVHQNLEQFLEFDEETEITSSENHDHSNNQTFIERSDHSREEKIESTNQTEEHYEEMQFNYYVEKGRNTPKLLKCVVCMKQNPKYTCPKCNVKYCSIEHYKSHNLFCSQKFYKEQVEAQLKQTKADKQQKLKTKQYLKTHHEQMSVEENIILEEIGLKQIEESRLNEILSLINQNRISEISLNEAQSKRFQFFLGKVSSECQGEEEEIAQHQEELKQQAVFQSYVPFWEVKDGLSQYFIQSESISIEQFNQSKHQDVISYRQVTSQILREETRKIDDFIQLSKLSPLINFELLQVVFLEALLFRTFDGEYLQNQEFLQTFFMIYTEDFAKTINSMYKTNKVTDIINQDISIISIIQIKIMEMQNKNKQLFEVMKTWKGITEEDCLKIIQNKYVCIEALMRLVEVFRRANSIKWSDPLMNDNLKENQNKIQKKSKEVNNKFIKISKKIQVLIAYTNDVLFLKENKESSCQILQQNNLEIIKNCLKRQISLKQERSRQAFLLELEKTKQKQRSLNGIMIPMK